MIIVGGTYEENCLYPPHNKIMGSGLRAACALFHIDNDLKLVSAIDETMQEGADVTMGSFDFPVTWSKRNEPVIFNYYTPLSSPTINGRLSHARELIIENTDAALVFGMIESNARVNADYVIFDPQQPRDAIQLDLGCFNCNHLALVANIAETQTLGNDPDIRIAAINLLSSTKADVVITKQGARGALVTTEEYQKEIGPHPTKSIMPIGSGDVFAAGFAWAWASLKYDPLESARVGSAAAAYYVSTETLPLSKDTILERTNLESALEPKDTKIYLAGPFFCLSELWLVDTLNPVIYSLGASTFSPLHHIGIGGEEVAKKDLEGLNECNSVLALLDNLDAGTLFEIGWANKAKIPVVGYVSKIDDEALKMLKGSGVELYDDLSTAVYRSIWRGMGAQPLE